MAEQSGGGPRKRDSAATRSALLKAAAELFAERGYEQTTVREVAARAGANQALLFRYFGSKQALFAEVLKLDSDALLEAGPAETLPLRILADLLSAKQTTGAEHPLVTMLHSFSDERAAQLLREELGDRYAERLAELTAGPEAQLRADLVLAWLFGLSMLRSVLGKHPLSDAPPETVLAHVMPAIAVLLERAELP